MSKNFFQRSSFLSTSNSTLRRNSFKKEKSIRDSTCNRRKNCKFGINRYVEQTKELQQFQKKNLKHMIVKAPSVKKSRTSSFGQFYLLSALPEDVAPLSHENATRKFIDPFFCKAMNVVDRYPQITSIGDNELTPEEVASICFPSGIKMKLIPRCALDKGAKRLIGDESDRYHLHAVSIDI